MEEKLKWRELTGREKAAFVLTLVLATIILPISLVGWVLHKVARLILALSYVLMFRFTEARDIVKYMFDPYGK